MNKVTQWPPASQMAVVFWLVVVGLVALDLYLPPGIEKQWWYVGLVRGVLVVATLGWLFADAAERGLPPPRGYAAFAPIALEIVVPVYLVKTRGWKGFGLWCVRNVGALLLCTLALAVVSVAAERFAAHAA